MKIIKLIFILIVGVLNAQVGINTTTPEESSILDVKIDGNRKTVTVPRISLKSITDKTGIDQQDPAHGLMVYNLNSNLKEGKGLYWWDENDERWLAVINQVSRAYYADLVQYKVSQSFKPIDMTEQPYLGEELYKKEEPITNGWTEIPDLKIDFNISKPENNSRVTFTGTIGLSRFSPTQILQDISIGYGIFIDDKLVDARADVVLLKDYCGYQTFYVTAIIDKLPIGNHNIKFAIKKRARSNKGERNGFTIGGNPNYSYYNGYGYIRNDKCSKINSFEAHPAATLYIVQKP